MKDIIAVDLFCGAGGLTRGLLDAKIKVTKGFDNNENFKETYEKNNPGTVFSSKDICDLTGSEVLKDLDLKNNYLLLAGGVPCQPFSNINKKEVTKDNRKFLLLEFGRLVEETKPDFIFIENVPGLATGKGRIIFETFKKKLKKMKYHFDYNVVDAKSYGVPQKRMRLILLASAHTPIKFPKPTHGKEKSLSSYVTVRDAISSYPAIKAGAKHKTIFNHNTRSLSTINKTRLEHIKKNGGSRFDLPDDLVLDCHKKHNGHSDVYGRMWWDKASPTLTCKCTSISNGRFAHPTQKRGISVREAAALQTFDDNYRFYGTLTNNTIMVGNAVPPLLAKKIGIVFLNKDSF